ncbi:MAG: 1,4-beta-xylanase [Deltaproteobacteria bacterium]|nr:1,4-beta-xylanase [Deltaproteobacteria bacterium]
MSAPRSLLAAALVLALALAGCGSGSASAPSPPVERDADGRWTAASATAWYDAQPWLVGANFIPSTAINQLEMWQADTFDPDTIDRELGWASGVGMNVMRVFLHDLLWEPDPRGLVERVDRYLAIADRHGIRTMLVLFDNVWDAEAHLGPQPEPVPGVHNSGWVQSPAKQETLAFANDPALRARLERYVKGVLGAFRDDRRVLMWDLLNEPGNSNIHTGCLPLLEATFGWAREVAPSQPLTAGSWFLQTWAQVSKTSLDLSDVATFHNYDVESKTEAVVDPHRRLHRPASDLHRVHGAYRRQHLPDPPAALPRPAGRRHPLGPGLGQDADDLAVGLAAEPGRGGAAAVVPRRVPRRRGAV